MRYVELRYGVTFGKGDSSDWIDYEIDLTDEEAAAYDKAIAEGRSLDNVPELQDALQRAYEEIEEMEIENGIDMEDEYVMECQGLAPMDEDELNEEYILPFAFDKRIGKAVAKAVSQAAINSGVARITK